MKKLLLVLLALICISGWAGEESIFRLKGSRVEEGHTWTGLSTAWAVDAKDLGYEEGFYIISAGHSVVDSQNFQVEIKGEWYKCKVIKYSAKRNEDCALLKVDYDDEDSIPKIKLKEEIVTVLVYNQDKHQIEVRSKAKRDLFYIKAHIREGNSGGPVLNENEEAVGLVRGYIPSEELGVVVPTSAIIEVVKK